MDLKISQSEIDGICLLELRGHLVFGDSEASLREYIVKLQNAGSFKVILNLEGTREVDANGLGALTLCSANLLESGGALKLLNPSAAKLDPNTFMKLETEFDVFTDQQQAIDSFFPDRAVTHFDILDFVDGLKKHPLPDAS